MYEAIFAVDVHINLVALRDAVFSSPLPEARVGVYLVLSNVEDKLVQMAWRAAAALEPKNNGYLRISFPGGRMETTGWRRLLEYLAAARVKVREVGWRRVLQHLSITKGWIVVPKTTITEKEETELNNVANTLLGCGLMREAEDMLWWSFRQDDV